MSFSCSGCQFVNSFPIKFYTSFTSSAQYSRAFTFDNFLTDDAFSIFIRYVSLIVIARPVCYHAEPLHLLSLFLACTFTRTFHTLTLFFLESTLPRAPIWPPDFFTCSFLVIDLQALACHWAHSTFVTLNCILDALCTLHLTGQPFCSACCVHVSVKFSQLVHHLQG